MQVINSITEWQKTRRTLNAELGFVPTMGNLHAGHASLLKCSVQENKITVLSIFVNPTQFNNTDDLKKYPRTLDQDLQLAQSAGVNYVLVPEYNEIYNDNYAYKVSENQFSKILCGQHRPGHFDGVLTVILKLLNIVKPHKIYFGEKDFQQLQLIRAMVQALFIDTEVISCKTVRDENGLAMSSRNNRLTPSQYQHALQFPRILQLNKSCNEISKLLTEQGFKVDYVEEQHGRRLSAIWIDDIRLIDNILI